MHEPLAADARRYADGKQLARLKLIAGILGIRLDELRRRDAQRRQRQRLCWSVAALVTFGVIGWLGWTTAITRETVRVQRTNTEELLSFMLGDLKRLDPIAGLEIVDKDDPELQRYRVELGFDALSNETLVAAALEWRNDGIERHRRGELESAMRRFQQSRAAFVELHQREGGTRRALFELGQAEFWVGSVHMNRGELDEAQASFSRYGAVTRRLVNAEPNDASLVMELAYTLVNLGGLERSRTSPDTNKILQLFQSALQYNQLALVLDPDNDLYRQDMVNVLAFLADAWLDTCDLGKAFELRSQNVALSRELLKRSPANPQRRKDLAFALMGLGKVQQEMGLSAMAGESLRESERLLNELYAADPGNANLRWQALLRAQRLTRLVAAEGRADEAWAIAQPLAALIDAFVAQATGGNFATAVDAAQFRVDYARIAYERGLEDQGRQAIERAIAELSALVRDNPAGREGVFQLAGAAFEYWRRIGELPGSGVAALLDDYLDGSEPPRSCADAGMAARLALLRGDRDRAVELTRYVLRKGYFDPEFVNFCRSYELCDLDLGDRPSPAAAEVDRAAQVAKSQPATEP